MKYLPHKVFIVTPSLEGWPAKAKEVSSRHEIRLTRLNTNLVRQSLGEKILEKNLKSGWRNRLVPIFSSRN